MLDTPVPTNKDLLTPRTPSKYKHKFVPQSLKSISSKVRVKINSFADWLLSYIPPETTKVVIENLESLKNRVSEIYRGLSEEKKEPEETKSVSGKSLKFERLRQLRTENVKVIQSMGAKMLTQIHFLIWFDH